MFPIIGARKFEHVKAFNDSLSVALTQEDLGSVDNTVPFSPLFPMTFLYEFGVDRKYNLSLTAADNFMYRMAAQIDHPEDQQVSSVSVLFSGCTIADIYSQSNRNRSSFIPNYYLGIRTSSDATWIDTKLVEGWKTGMGWFASLR